jgi:hypothetical protein
VRSTSDEATAKNAGAHDVLVSDKELSSRARACGTPRAARQGRRCTLSI